MKPSFLLVASTIALTSVISQASATTVTLHGAGFQAQTGTDEQYLTHMYNGTANSSTVDKGVTLSIARIPQSSGNQNVYVDGWHSASSVSTICQVYVVSYNGSYLAGKSFTVSGVTGYWERSLTFSPAETPYYSYMMVFCALPRSNTARLLGVTVNGA